MQRLSKTKAPCSDVAAREVRANDGDVTRIVEGLLDVLGQHDAHPDQGVLSLVAAFMQAADRVLELSTPDDAEHNRAALLGLLDRARGYLDAWPQRIPTGWTVH